MQQSVLREKAGSNRFTNWFRQDVLPTPTSPINTVLHSFVMPTFACEPSSVCTSLLDEGATFEVQTLPGLEKPPLHPICSLGEFMNVAYPTISNYWRDLLAMKQFQNFPDDRVLQ
jgi:hypothetical protein